MEDQKIKADYGKPKLSLVPMQILTDIARVREYGQQKYKSANSWKDVSIDRYRDAMLRHMVAYISDTNGVDEESGLSHLSHLACNVAFLCELEKDNNAETINAETSLIMGGVVAELKKENEKLKFLLRLAIDTLESSECEDFSYCDVCTDYIIHDKECKNGYECFFRWEHSDEAERLIGGDE